jgi:hypothetical protein
MCLSGPTIIFGFGAVVVVVVELWSCVVPAAGVCVLEAVEPFCVWLELLVSAGAGAVVVVVLPLFFFVLAVAGGVGVLCCAVAIEPATRNALTQKPAANFRYRFITDLSRNFVSTASSTPTPTLRVDTTSAAPRS